MGNPNDGGSGGIGGWIWDHTIGAVSNWASDQLGKATDRATDKAMQHIDQKTNSVIADIKDTAKGIETEVKQGLSTAGDAVSNTVKSLTGIDPNQIGTTPTGQDDSDQQGGFFGNLFKGGLRFLENIPFIGFFVKLFEAIFSFFGSMFKGATGLFGGDDGSKGGQDGVTLASMVKHPITSLEHGADYVAYEAGTILGWDKLRSWGATNLQLGMIKQESGGKVDAKSPVGAYGLTQLMPETGEAMAKKMGVKYDPNDAHQNFILGTAYLNEMQQRYHGNVEMALAAYNAGPGNVDKAVREHGDNWLAAMPKEETRKYVPAVLANARHFELQEAAQRQAGATQAQYNTAALDVNDISRPLPGHAPKSHNPGMIPVVPALQV